MVRPVLLEKSVYLPCEVWARSSCPYSRSGYCNAGVLGYASDDYWAVVSEEFIDGALDYGGMYSKALVALADAPAEVDKAGDTVLLVPFRGLPLKTPLGDVYAGALAQGLGSEGVNVLASSFVDLETVNVYAVVCEGGPEPNVYRRTAEMPVIRRAAIAVRIYNDGTYLWMRGEGTINYGLVGFGGFVERGMVQLPADGAKISDETRGMLVLWSDNEAVTWLSAIIVEPFRSAGVGLVPPGRPVPAPNVCRYDYCGVNGCDTGGWERVD